jgi:integrase
VALRRNDVDLLRGTIRIDEELQEVNSRSEWLTDDERGQVYAEPKTAESVRTVTVPKFIRELLGEHLPSGLPAGVEEDALIFPSPTGLPMRHNLLYSRKFRPAVHRVFPDGHPKRGLRWHDLRHTCASLSLAVTPSLHLVKEDLATAISGRPSTITGTYCHR